MKPLSGSVLGAELVAPPGEDSNIVPGPGRGSTADGFAWPVSPGNAAGRVASDGPDEGRDENLSAGLPGDDASEGRSRLSVFGKADCVGPSLPPAFILPSDEENGSAGVPATTAGDNDGKTAPPPTSDALAGRGLETTPADDSGRSDGDSLGRGVYCPVSRGLDRESPPLSG